MKRRWPRHIKHTAHSSQEGEHAGFIVLLLLRLIFTVPASPPCFHNPVICGLQTQKHTQRISMSAHANRWLKAIALSEVPFCCRHTHTSNPTQLVKVCTHGVSEGRIGGVALWFSTSSCGSHWSFFSPQIYTNTESLKGRSVFFYYYYYYLCHPHWHIQ